MKKKLTTVLAIVLVVALSVAGTYAYLTAQTDTVKNTFTAAGLASEFSLDESKANQQPDGSYTLDVGTRVQENAYSVVPKVNLDKDPTVHVTLEKNVGAYVFLAVDNNLGNGLTATIDSTWTALGTTYTDAQGVVWTMYYKQLEGSATPAQVDINVLAGQQIVVGDTVAEDCGNIVFNAYLTQSAGFTGALDAWNNSWGK
ncbi:MAG: SipW-dependent-type signal peptide-containing protein [Firmicutes bacterium]|nr:SipW-dependent-type signal peptide-containing protein [Bacillota bacterium]